MRALSDEEYIKVCIGRQTNEELKNIVRELKDIWRWIDTIRPQAKCKVTKDKLGQYYITLNGRALKYLLVYMKNVPPVEPFWNDGEKTVVPMPPDFGTKEWASSQHE